MKYFLGLILAFSINVFSCEKCEKIKDIVDCHLSYYESEFEKAFMYFRQDYYWFSQGKIEAYREIKSIIDYEINQ